MTRAERKAARKIVRDCRAAGVELLASCGDTRIRVLHRLERLPAGVRKIVADNKPLLLEYLAVPLDPDNWDFRTLGELRERKLFPPPPWTPPTKFESLTADYGTARGKGESRFWPWEAENPSPGQLAYLRRIGASPPADATKGECSFAITVHKLRQGGNP